MQGTEPGKDIALPATDATADKFEGVVMYSANVEMDDDGAVLLRKNQIVDVCQSGKLWVQLVDSVEPAYGQPVYLVTTGTDAGKFTPTKGTNLAVKARFIGAAVNGIAPAQFVTQL